MPHDQIPLNDVVACRELHVADSEQKVLVRIGKPQIIENDAKCAYRISYGDYTFGMDVWGIDGFQAIQLAMKMLPIELRNNANFPVGKIYQFELGDDMGFPLQGEQS